MKDTLRGSDRLNWSADRAISELGGHHGERARPAGLRDSWLDRNTSPQLYGRRITLTGTIPAALGGLSKLQRLTLARHELTGTIPVELANLSELTDLRLFGNQLTGGIPPQLGNLSNLTRLDLGTETRWGAPFRWNWGSCRTCARCAWRTASLTGSIPASLGALSNLTQLDLYGNTGLTGLTGCVPASLRGIRGIGLGSLGLEYCTTTTTYSLTVTAATGNGRVSPLPGTYSYLSGASVTVTATPDAGWRIASWGDDCSASGTATTCPLTMNANKTASVTFARITHTLTVTAEGEGGSVTPPGTTTHGEGEQVTVTATPEAGYRVDSWGGDCSASGANLACVLTMDGDKAASVTFEEGTAYTLTISAGANGSVSPAPGTYRYDEDEQVTVTATPDAGYRVTSWGGDCSGSGTNVICALTMDGNKTASVTFEQGTAYTLTTTAGEGGSVTPGGTTTHHEDAEVTLTASWNDATHTFSGWGGDCSGTATTCELTMDAARTVTATFAALAADRCAEPTDADCIRAVYLGAPGDYAQVVDIPADVLLTPAADGRYYVERGRQYTVVTAAPLPAGWTRFYLERTPLGDPHAVSHEQLIPPVGTTYTFTVTEDEAAATLITFDLKEARPFVRPRPDGKPDIGDTVVTTVFSVATTAPRYNAYDTTGAVTTPGSYAFLSDPDETTTAVTTYEALRDGTTTALLINKADAHGASQAALYNEVEVGDLFEWHKADDCFVRYSVTRVKPDPTGDVPKKALDVAWMTYAFTGCSGTISTSDAVQIVWGALPNLGGDSLTVPVIHGIYQIAPRDWDGTTREVVGKRPPRSSTATYTENIVVARTLDFWREPTVPRRLGVLLGRDRWRGVREWDHARLLRRVGRS